MTPKSKLNSSIQTDRLWPTTPKNPPPKDFDLFIVLRHRVTCTQFLQTDRKGDPWQVFYYQTLGLLDDIAVECHGRKTGKTSDIKAKFWHQSINFPGAQGLFATQSKINMVDPMQEIMRVYEEHWFFKHFKHTINRGNSEAHVYLKNRYKLHFRIAGLKAKLAQNLEGPHVDAKAVDEVKFWLPISEDKITQCANDFDEEMGSFDLYTSTPDGRIDTVLYEKDNSDPYTVGHRYKYPSWMNPSQYSFKRHCKYLKQYGGSIHSNMYLQMARGEHGEPLSGGFNMPKYMRCINNQMEWKEVVLTEQRFKDGSWEQAIRRLPKRPDDAVMCLLSGDYGQVEPTEWLVNFKVRNHWQIQGLVQMPDVSSENQCRAFHLLKKLYRPDWWGLDTTGPGNGYWERIINKALYREGGHAEEIGIPVNFTEKMLYKEKQTEDGEAVPCKINKYPREYKYCVKCKFITDCYEVQTNSTGSYNLLVDWMEDPITGIQYPDYGELTDEIGRFTVNLKVSNEGKKKLTMSHNINDHRVAAIRVLAVMLNTLRIGNLQQSKLENKMVLPCLNKMPKRMGAGQSSEPSRDDILNMTEFFN